MGGGARQWQCVLVAWGEKYTPPEIDLLVGSVLALAHPPRRVVLLTDRPRPLVHRAVEQRPIPDWYLTEAFRRGGCQTKLCLFEPGVVPDDMVAVYVDLDTMILGDLSRVLSVWDRPQAVAILQSAVLPFGRLARVLNRVTRGKVYARGNSSVVVYHPAHCGYIAAEFRRLHGLHGMAGFRPLIADERFISWVAQPHMRAVPNALVVKFPTEYMMPWKWLVHLRGAAPWIRARRDGLVAVTFPGLDLKGSDLAALPDGAVIVDRKGRRLFWTAWAVGRLRDRVIAHYGPGPG